MTKPKWESLYCSVCGTPMGKKPGHGAVVNLLCGEPSCEITGQAGVGDARNAVIVAVAYDRVPVPKIALAFDKSRQRIYQIVHDWEVGK